MSYQGNSLNYQVYPTDTFSGNGTQKVFTLTYNVSGESSILVWVNGLKRYTYDYTVEGSVLTFITAPPSGMGNVEVFYLNIPELSYSVTQGVTFVGLTTSLSGITVAGSPIISTGTFSLGGTLGVGSGGTGNVTFPTNQVLLGNGSNNLTSVSTLGSTGQVLTSQGSNAPTWTNAVNSLSTGTTGLTLNSSTGNLTLSGTLTVANGGTGANTFTQFDVLLGNGTSAVTSVGGTGTNNFVLTSNGPNQKPTWQARPTADSNFQVGALLLGVLNTSDPYPAGSTYIGSVTVYGAGPSSTTTVTGTFLVLGAINAGSEECLLFRSA
jgi:hypothetical protein